MDRNILIQMRSDGRGGYLGYELRKWLKRRSIVHEVRTADLPDSNGRPERLNRYLMYFARILMLAIPSPKFELWAEAVNTAC